LLILLNDSVRPLVILLSSVMLAMTLLPCCALSDLFSYSAQHEEKHHCGEHNDDGCGDCGQYASCALCMGFVVPSTQISDIQCPYPAENERSFSKIQSVVRTVEYESGSLLDLVRKDRK
jgi:hypothetical protein